MSMKVLALFGMIGVLGGIGVPCVYSQAVDSTIGAQVERAVHGPDGEGRDGPMATLDRELISLYYEYRAHRQRAPDDPFSSSVDGLPVQDTLVTVDAIAKASPAELLDRLQALGLKNGAKAGRLVSGELPITSLRSAAGLSLLQSMRAARTRPRANTGGLRPASPDANGEPEADETSPVGTTSDSDPPSGGTAPIDSKTTGRTDGPAEPSADTAAATPAGADSGEARADQSEGPPQLPSPPGGVRTNTEDGASGQAARTADSWSWIGYLVGGVVLLVIGLLVVRRRRA
jgi:hypothetical protein